MSTPQRRFEDRTLVTYAWSILAGERIRTMHRLIALSHAMALTWWGAGLLFPRDPDPYGNALYDGVFAAAHPIAWGIGFWVVAALMLYAATTARALVYVLAIVAWVGLLSGWVTGLTAMALLDDSATLTSGSLARDHLVFTGLAAIVLAPNPLRREPELFERRESGELALVHSIERRAG